MSLKTLIIALAIPLMAHATPTTVTLPPIEASTEKSLPVNPEEPNIPCDQILDRLSNYNDLAREHDASVANFLSEVTSKLTEWHDLLSPLEGSEQNLPQDTFSPLVDGADKVTQVTDLAWENSSLLANELDRIRVSLAECQIGKKVEPSSKTK